MTSSASRPGWGRLFWPVLFFPLLAFSFLTLLRLARSAPPRARSAIQLALGLLVVALIVEVAWAGYVLSDGDPLSWPNTLEVGFEEGAELAAWFLIVGALASIAVAALVERGVISGPRAKR